MKTFLPDIITKFEITKVKYEVHHFDSGVVMVDIFINNKFYVIQIDEGQIGLSTITEDTGLFEVIPDKSFEDFNKFKTEF